MSVKHKRKRKRKKVTKQTPYQAFLSRKSQYGSDHGFDPIWVPDFLFPFQQTLVEWALQRGRAAIFADCGLGKTPMQLVWAENVAEKTNGRILIIAPLAVAQQTIREGEKFDIDCARVRSSGDIKDKHRILITNYEKLHKFSSSDFAGVVCDESSAIKAFDGKRRALVTEFLRTIPYRLLCTATAAPNDYAELGTSSEALGELGCTDMISKFFIDKTTAGGQSYGTASKWRKGPRFRFKGHAQEPFWKWVCSWARACRYPSDLGFDDDGFKLPALIEREHVIETRVRLPGMLFALPARNMQEEREERRRTLHERCDKVAELVANTKRPAVVWCHLNAEGDLLEEIIPDAGQVKGANTDEEKEEVYEAFSSKQLRVIVIKPKIGAFGLNWQHCSHVITFASHSYEQYYQSIRRCWRFGQKRRVVVDLVATEGEQGIKENLRRKAEAADQMFTELTAYMNEAIKMYRGQEYPDRVEVPEWLS